VRGIAVQRLDDVYVLAADALERPALVLAPFELALLVRSEAHVQFAGHALSELPPERREKSASPSVMIGVGASALRRAHCLGEQHVLVVGEAKRVGRLALRPGAGGRA